MIVVDTSVWVDYFNGVISSTTDQLHHLLGQRSILIGDIILAEVLQGFKNNIDFKKAKQSLEIFPFAEMLGKNVAIESALNYRRLRAKGATVRKTIDVIIGTFCIINQLPLLHNDRDFLLLEKHCGLQIFR